MKALLSLAMNCKVVSNLPLSPPLASPPSQLQVDKRDDLFNMTTQWLGDDKPSHRRLASQLCGIFVDAEESGFQRRLNDLLPQVAELIQPEQLVEVRRAPSSKTLPFSVRLV